MLRWACSLFWSNEVSTTLVNLGSFKKIVFACALCIIQFASVWCLVLLSPGCQSLFQRSDQVAEKFPDKNAKLIIGCQMGSRSAQVD